MSNLTKGHFNFSTAHNAVLLLITHEGVIVVVGAAVSIGIGIVEKLTCNIQDIEEPKQSSKMT